MTLEEYLNCDNGTDIRYELVNGELIETQRDYRYKRSEYAARGIAKYWSIRNKLRWWC